MHSISIVSVSRQLGAQMVHNPEVSQGWQLPGWEQGPAQDELALSKPRMERNNSIPLRIKKVASEIKYLILKRIS